MEFEYIIIGALVVVGLVAFISVKTGKGEPVPSDAAVPVSLVGDLNDQNDEELFYMNTDHNEEYFVDHVVDEIY